MPLRVLQINVDGTKRIVAEAREVAIRNKVDVIAVQEPYMYKGKIVGFGLSSKLVYGGGTDARGVGAAIIGLNAQIGLTRIQGLSDKNCVVAEVLNAGQERFYLVSIYCRYSERIDRYLRKLRDIARCLKGQEVVICMDSNARSPLWGDRIQDDKGRALEEQIEESGYTILNDPMQGPTFEKLRQGQKESVRTGTSYIDLTLANSQVTSGHVHDWQLQPEWVIGGHRPITMEYRHLTRKTEG